LIKNGANVNFQDKEKRYPLDVIAERLKDLGDSDSLFSIIEMASGISKANDLLKDSNFDIEEYVNKDTESQTDLVSVLQEIALLLAMSGALLSAKGLSGKSTGVSAR